MDPFEELRAVWEAYQPMQTRENDFDAFWEKTIAQARSVALDHEIRRISYPMPSVRVHELTYVGWGGTKVHGWYLVPDLGGKHSKKHPCVIHYHGFGGDRGCPCDFAALLMQGVSVFSADCRDQGGSTGTSAAHDGGSMNHVMMRGILNPDEYYCRSTYMDCFRLIDLACALDEVDASRIILMGGSQGGGHTIAMAALHDRAALAIADVPSASDLAARVHGGHGAFGEIRKYLCKYPDRYEAVMRTLSYFDTMNMAELISCPVVASVGGKDETCPPQMFYATYNRIRSPKTCYIYPFNGHEGGHRVHNEVKLQAVRDFLDGKPVF